MAKRLPRLNWSPRDCSPHECSARDPSPRAVASRAGSNVGGQGFFEQLEVRRLMTAFSWTPEEVYTLELVNRARANPVAEGARLGVDLTAGLTTAEAAHLVPQEPLAFNPQLTTAARAMSLDMAQRDFFDHIDPDGRDPSDRAHNAGYTGNAGENIAAGYRTIDAVHLAWLQSVGHRKNVLSLHADFGANFHYDEFGAGVAHTSIGPFFDYHTEEFGVQAGTPLVYLLGVAYTDTDGNSFYGLGEGMGGVRVDVLRQGDPSQIAGTYTTDSAGNYQIAVAAGAYIARFTDGATGLVHTQQFTLSTTNVKIDARAAQLSLDPDSPPPDDRANSGDLAHATPITIGPGTGDGEASGQVEWSTDTDLYRFTASVTGAYTISAGPVASSLHAQVGLYGQMGNALGNGVAAGAGGAGSALHYNLVAGQTYYVQVQGRDGTVGGYAVSVDYITPPSAAAARPVGGPPGVEPPAAARVAAAQPGAAPRAAAQPAAEPRAVVKPVEAAKPAVGPPAAARPAVGHPAAGPRAVGLQVEARPVAGPLAAARGGVALLAAARPGAARPGVARPGAGPLAVARPAADTPPRAPSPRPRRRRSTARSIPRAASP